jgi:putative endonuclease
MRIGTQGEEIAAQHLAARGFRVVARNWRPRAVGLRGEIDLVAVRGNLIVVVEVKTRRGEGFGGPLAAVTWEKQRRLRRLAAAFLADSGLRARDVRFDVIAVRVGPSGATSVEHLEGAF